MKTKFKGISAHHHAIHDLDFRIAWTAANGYVYICPKCKLLTLDPEGHTDWHRSEAEDASWNSRRSDPHAL